MRNNPALKVVQVLLWGTLSLPTCVYQVCLDGVLENAGWRCRLVFTNSVSMVWCSLGLGTIMAALWLSRFLPVFYDMTQTTISTRVLV